MVKQCCEDKEIPLYDNGKIKRDYIYIDDAVRGIATVAQYGMPGSVYFVGSGVGTTFNKMVNIMMKEAGGGRIRVVESPGFHKRIGIGDFWCDSGKLQSYGWKPQIDIQEGIKRTVAFYRNN
jgi:nucleoside-diphosphate-sugar epimerase